MPRVRRRYLLGAFGDPGHAFPTIALGRALAARGHDVTLQTWTRWRAEVQALGMRFAPAPEYPVFPTQETPLAPYEAAYRATLDTDALVAEVRPDAVVADILTLGPALAAERAGVRVATLIPHVHPDVEPGWPPYSLGARLPRTPIGRGLWRALAPLTSLGLERGRRELNETRRRLGLAPLDRVHGGISPDLVLVATLPELEYPRRWPDHVHVVGPMSFAVDGPDVDPPAGDDPLVLVAPSTVHDPGQRLLRACLEGLADAPVRLLASAPRGAQIAAPPNARIVEWLAYERAMPGCRLVVSHAGHGTLMCALRAKCPVLAVPAAGDMNENAARLAWAGLGMRVPRRWATPRTLRLTVLAALDDRAMLARARTLRAPDGAERGADLLEAFAAPGARATLGALPARAAETVGPDPG